MELDVPDNGGPTAEDIARTRARDELLAHDASCCRACAFKLERLNIVATQLEEILSQFQGQGPAAMMKQMFGALRGSQPNS